MYVLFGYQQPMLVDDMKWKNILENRKVKAYVS